MKIITISREFGSGGRELGKRLADYMNIDYYDHEIIAAFAQAKGMQETYVEKALEGHGWRQIPLTYRHSFTSGAMLREERTGLLLAQKHVIDGIAQAGQDCVIIGRDADILLAEKSPFRIFVCADMEAKIQRCMERAPEGESLSRKEVERNIRRIDRARAQSREMLAGGKWGHSSSYHLTVNTSGWNIKELTPAVAAFAECWFGRTQKG